MTRLGIFIRAYPYVSQLYLYSTVVYMYKQLSGLRIQLCINNCSVHAVNTTIVYIVDMYMYGMNIPNYSPDGYLFTSIGTYVSRSYVGFEVS